MGILTKLLISQLLIALEYKTWYQSNAKTWYSYIMVEYEKNLIWNEWKIAEKSRRYT